MANFKHLNLSYNDPAEKAATLTINRPDSLNALNSELGTELNLAIDDIESKIKEVRVLIITGAGEKSFMAGADITEMVKMSPPEARNFLHNVQEALNRLESLPVPVIAKINGYALGGGLELALACDIRIASDKAFLGLPEVTLGLIPSGGGTQRLTRIAGEGVAKYLIMSAKRLSAAEALSYKIVSEVVSHEELDDRITEFIHELYKLAPIALGGAKRAIQSSFNEPMNSGLEIELDEAVMCFQSKDLREGMNAFVEKRRPVFQNK